MPLIRFLASSFALSFPVMLRMLPIFLVTALLVFAAFTALVNYPFYLGLVIFVVAFPLLTFLTICAIRAGLVQRKQSGSPVLGGLVRKSLILGYMLNWMAILFVGLGYVATSLILGASASEEWLEIAGILQTAQANGQSSYAAVAYLSPMLANILVVITVLYYLASAALAVPIAAHCASIGVNGPRHEFFFGIGRKTGFVLAVMLLTSAILYLGMLVITPALARTYPALAEYAAGTAGTAAVMPFVEIAAAALLLQIWLFCWVSAACSVAYVQARTEIEEEFQRIMGAILDSAEPQADLRALIRERAEKARLVLPVSSGGSFDDLDAPAQEEKREDEGLFSDAGAESGQAPAPPIFAPSALPANPAEIEERFSSRFGPESGTGLRQDMASALRDAAELEPVRPDAEPAIDPVGRNDIVPGKTAPVKSKRVSGDKSDLPEEVPESDEPPDWLNKYMGRSKEESKFDDEK